MVKNRSYDVRKGICDQGFSLLIIMPEVYVLY